MSQFDRSSGFLCLFMSTDLLALLLMGHEILHFLRLHLLHDHLCSYLFCKLLEIMVHLSLIKHCKTGNELRYKGLILPLNYTRFLKIMKGVVCILSRLVSLFLSSSSLPIFLFYRFFHAMRFFFFFSMCLPSSTFFLFRASF